jgi:putative endonuclease
MSSLRSVGREEEDRAALYLIEQGYTVVTRRYKARRGEIDLIALDGDVLVFIEVKARFTEGYLPEEALTDGKRRALYRAGQAYLADVGETRRAIRFDLIAIDRNGLRHHKDVLAI